GVVLSGGDRTSIVVRDGAYAFEREVDVEAKTAADLRFVDVDGDGRAEIASERVSDQGEHQFEFAIAVGLEPHDLAAGMAAMGAAARDAAVARALAVPAQPVADADACALLRGIKSPASLRRAGVPGVRVLGFTEPGEPEIGHGDAGREGVRMLHDHLGRGCDV